MTEHLCVIGGCVDFGQHQADCASERCRGCLPRVTERGLVCNPHRYQLPGDFDQVEELWRRLATREDHTDTTAWTVRQVQRWPVPTTNPSKLQPWVDGPWVDAPGADATLTVAPAGPIGRSHQRRVSGSRHAPVPANLNQLDLTADARQGSRAPHARGILGLDPDQTGHLAIATELDTIAREWRNTLWPDQHLPVPTVPALVAWLKHRIDDACNSYLAIDEDVAVIWDLRSAAVAVLGLNPARKELCRGVICRSCDRISTLYRDGSHVQCGWCHQYYSEHEYQEWVALLDADTKRRIKAGVLKEPDRSADRPERTDLKVHISFPNWVHQP